ncbi:hypothetical protein CTEN210_00294 [Chaetoceros tenuissimus]|uniref:Leucine-rich repeat domain-containing protein n=1 Tax=Chaetoceros tenuissimus TaxID=426638 RepID=A0AAD3CFF6_9STRA|nr:hypothetical protein CTEN210_00294 [Chaetoceros tenuissimus]
MRVANINGLVTLFYDGSKKLFNEELDYEWYEKYGNGMYGLTCLENFEDFEEWNVSKECKNYMRERQTWRQIIIVDGVTEIPDFTFHICCNIERVIFANTVIRIGEDTFSYCINLEFIKFSSNLEFIGDSALQNCNLSSIFIPPRCREIGEYAFRYNKNLEIFHVPRSTVLGYCIIDGSKLIRRSPQVAWNGYNEDVDLNLLTYYFHRNMETNAWLGNINNEEEFALHKICSSFEPTLEMILDTMVEKGGLASFQVENSIGITPSRYLKENPYVDVTEKEIVEKYVLKMMGELETD